MELAYKAWQMLALLQDHLREIVNHIHPPSINLEPQLIFNYTDTLQSYKYIHFNHFFFGIHVFILHNGSVLHYVCRKGMEETQMSLSCFWVYFWWVIEWKNTKNVCTCKNCICMWRWICKYPTKIETNLFNKFTGYKISTKRIVALELALWHSQWKHVLYGASILHKRWFTW